jgi:hypothetical protein
VLVELFGVLKLFANLTPALVAVIKNVGARRCERNGSKHLRTENGSRRGRNLALTGLCVPSSSHPSHHRFTPALVAVIKKVEHAINDLP